MSRRWQAHLELGFAARGPRTVLAHNLHRGPLQVQKALYPEGPGTCHLAVLHPPGGIASGDSLTCDVRLGAGARACLTTPGATKWYRCPELPAVQRLRFTLEDRAVVEWLPRENILFNASQVCMELEVVLAGTATFFGWETQCFGRRASGERWDCGSLGLRTRIRRDGRLLWSECANIGAAGGFAASPAGLAGATVSATFIVAGPHTDAPLLAACRRVVAREPGARYGTTSLPGILLSRYLGHSSEDAFNWFTSLWKILRPAHLDRVAAPPRLWAC